jgi:hypothetical protein
MSRFNRILQIVFLATFTAAAIVATSSLASMRSLILWTTSSGRRRPVLISIDVVKIERIAPHTNFGGERCGSFGLAIFIDISATTVAVSRHLLTRQTPSTPSLRTTQQSIIIPPLKPYELLYLSLEAGRIALRAKSFARLLYRRIRHRTYASANLLRRHFTFQAALASRSSLSV